MRAFAPDGRILGTAGNDGTARLWDLTDPRRPAPLAVLTGHRDAVRTLAFSPDRRTVATGSSDGSALLWDIDVDAVAARVCRTVSPAVTAEEWRRYFPGHAYRPPCR